MTDADWIKEERDHEFRMAEAMNEANRVKQYQRTERAGYWATALGIVLALAVVAGAILYGVERSSQRSHEQEMACIEAGGTWTGVGGGSAVCMRVEAVR